MAKNKYTLKSGFWHKSEKVTGPYAWANRSKCDICGKIINGVSYNHLGDHKKYCRKCALEYLRKANAGEIEVKEKPRDTFLDQPIGDLIMIARDVNNCLVVPNNTRRAVNKVLDEFSFTLMRIEFLEKHIAPNNVDESNPYHVLKYIKQGKVD